MTGKRLHQALIDSSNAHHRRSRQAFQKYDLSPGQPKVLAYLRENEGCPQKELAGQCRVEPATMTILLRNMQLKDLIRKVPVHASSGKRAYGIYLTDRGREMARIVEGIVDEVETISFRGFSDRDKVILVELLQRITDNLE